ncbi:MAG: tol-pal system-associated acyl-CoA thioesterase [Pseudomonadota bacterium]
MANDAWPDIAGKIEDGVHRLAVRVYYEDTDFSGAVYHANYLKFCERGRSDCLRLLGVHHHELHWHETEGRMGFVVRRMVCDYLRPARIDDLLVVESRFLALRGARMEIAQRVMRGDEVLFTAEVTAALVDGNGRPKRMPAAIAEAVGRYL